MAHEKNQPAESLFLGIEGGGTRTVAILADGSGRLVRRIEAGPANVKLLSDAQLAKLFRGIARELPRPESLAIGMAGARSPQDLGRIRGCAEKVWPGIPCQVTNDLETALAAANNTRGHRAGATVLIVSGTGSCCYGRNQSGKTAKVGGWGHVLGDRGSAYQIALDALKRLVLRRDRDGVWPKFGARILQRLQLNEPDELIDWIQNAGKMEVAAVAVEVFNAGKAGDATASEAIAAAAESLAQDAIACARRLGSGKTSVQFVLAGGVLLRQPQFARRVAVRLKKLMPGAVVAPLDQEGVWGAVAIARNHQDGTCRAANVRPRRERKNMPGESAAASREALSPTEQRNPRSANLDKLSVRQAIKLMLSEDAKIPAVILAERKKIGRAVNLIARAFAKGGRLIYVGAGTSGRLGVLDASECPPTFRTDPEMVQGIIAGGQAALWRSVEGAEDDFDAGATAIALRKAGRRDVVVGIAASGRTPFVWGALGEANRRGSKTILLTFNPWLKTSGIPHLVIAPKVGPEILTGSTRLKAGTATKLVLNILTTLAMVRIGKVAGNLMVDLNPSNTKLRGRAVRIVRELCGVDEPSARAALTAANWVVQDACAKLGRRPRHRPAPKAA